MLDIIVTTLAQNGYAATIDGDTLHVGAYAVTASLTGDVRMTAANVGTLTVSSMRKGAGAVAQDIVAVLHHAG